MPWRTVNGDDMAPKGRQSSKPCLKGVFEPRRFLDFICGTSSSSAKPAATSSRSSPDITSFTPCRAVESTIRAITPPASSRPKGMGESPSAYGLPGVTDYAQGDKRIGVIWHTQGSGKSLLMAFYAGLIVKHPAMENPTLIVLTDRNDLDDQLFGTFSMCKDCCARRHSRPRIATISARCSTGRLVA